MNTGCRKFLSSIAAILLVSSAFCQSTLVLNGAYIVMSGGAQASPTYIDVSNQTPSGIVNKTPGTGWIISENEFNEVKWEIQNNTGLFLVPFGYSTAQYLPLTLTLNNAGIGAGALKFSTYHTPALNSINKPSDVNNLISFISPGSPSNADNSYNIADRFYIIDDSIYTTKPGAGNITFSYISGTVNTEVGGANILTENRLMAERYNSTLSTWNDWFGEGCTDAVVANVGTVQTGPVPASDMYRSWSLWDETMSLPLKTSAINNPCGNNSATVMAYGGVAPYTYSWSPSGGSNATANGLGAGTYTVTVRDNNGCSATASATITQSGSSLAVSILTATNSDGCNPNGSIIANAATGGSAPYTYSWSPTGGNGLTASNLSAGSYTIMAEDNNGCSVTASASISQTPSTLAATATVINNVTCLIGNTGSAEANPNGGNSPYVYSWTNGSSIISNSNPTGPALSAGTYTVTVQDNSDCSVTASVVILPGSSPVVSLCCDTAIIDGMSVPLYVTPDINGNTYNWLPVSGLSCTNCPTPIANPLITTTYTVTTTNKKGCATTDSVLITLKESCGPIYIPNAFSPNGDSWNDILYVKGDCIKNMDLSIYDRWGNKVFESTNPSVGWDGTYRGKAMNVGSYVYSLQITDLYNNSFTKKGSIALVR